MIYKSIFYSRWNILYYSKSVFFFIVMVFVFLAAIFFFWPSYESVIVFNVLFLSEAKVKFIIIDFTDSKIFLEVCFSLFDLIFFE